MARTQTYRSVFISDVHLGTKGCQAEMLLDFLKHVDAAHWYLVGDIVDGWRLKRKWYWPQAHNDVVQKLLRKARRGARLVYIPGNHDESFRNYFGSHFGGVEVQENAVHEAADGRRYLVLHGDEFDAVVRLAKWLAVLGDYGYRALLSFNTLFNKVRRHLGFGYWSLSAFVKVKVKNALQFIENYEEAVAERAVHEGVDGVICGHIHKAEQRMIGDIEYLNDGDWVESCTALVEHVDGRMEILHWANMVADRRTSSKLKQAGASG